MVGQIDQLTHYRKPDRGNSAPKWQIVSIQFKYLFKWAQLQIYGSRRKMTDIALESNEPARAGLSLTEDGIDFRLAIQTESWQGRRNRSSRWQASNELPGRNARLDSPDGRQMRN